MREDVGPEELEVGFLGGLVGWVVPKAQARFGVVVAAAWVIRPIRPGARVIRAEKPIYEDFLFFGMFAGVGPFGSDSVAALIGSAVSPFPADSQYATAAFTPMP